MPFVLLTDSAGNSKGFVFDANNNPIPQNNGNKNFSSLHPALSAGTAHLALVWGLSARGFQLTVYSAGSIVAEDVYYSDAGAGPPAAGAMTLSLLMPTDASALIDSVRVSSSTLYAAAFTPPSGPLARAANTLGLWQFDSSNGAGS